MLWRFLSVRPSFQVEGTSRFSGLVDPPWARALPDTPLSAAKERPADFKKTLRFSVIWMLLMCFGSKPLEHACSVERSGFGNR